jgi:hypothetical protein
MGIMNQSRGIEIPFDQVVEYKTADAFGKFEVLAATKDNKLHILGKYSTKEQLGYIMTLIEKIEKSDNRVVFLMPQDKKE